MLADFQADAEQLGKKKFYSESCGPRLFIEHLSTVSRVFQSCPLAVMCDWEAIVHFSALHQLLGSL